MTKVAPLVFVDDILSLEGWQPSPDDAVSEDDLATLGDDEEGQYRRGDR